MMSRMRPAGDPDRATSEATPARTVVPMVDGGGRAWRFPWRIVTVGAVVVSFVVMVNVALEVFGIIDTTTDVVRDLRDIEVPDVVPRAERIDLVGDGGQLRAVVDEIVAANAGSRAIEVVVYPKYLLACMVHERGGPQGVRYSFDAHGLQADDGICTWEPGEVFDTRRVSWDSVPGVAVAARRELDGAPGAVTHVVVDRALDDRVGIRAYYRSDDGRLAGYVSARADGTVQRVA
jgi:hypothetical protein